MDPKDYIPIIGWIVVFALGVLSGGVIIPRLTRKRKIVAWATLSENEIVPKQLSQTLALPVIITVGISTPSSLSTIHVRIGSVGNEVIENLEISVLFNEGSTLLNARPVDHLGEFGKHVSWIVDENRCRLSCKFLNPETSLDMEFLVSEYEVGSVDVDVSAPGVEIRRRDPTRWDVPVSALQSVTLSLMGVRYDPSIGSLNRIAEELKAIRRQFGSKQ